LQTRNNMFKTRCAKTEHVDGVLHGKKTTCRPVNYMWSSRGRFAVKRRHIDCVLQGHMASWETFYRGIDIVGRFTAKRQYGHGALW